MANECMLNNIKMIAAASDAYYTSRIKEESLPILTSHIELFYLLPSNQDKILFNELAKRYNISKSSLSDMIHKYKQLGIVDVSICHEDKRTIYVGLTDKALQIKSRLDVFEQAFLAKMLNGLSDSDQLKNQLIAARKNIYND